MDVDPKPKSSSSKKPAPASKPRAKRAGTAAAADAAAAKTKKVKASPPSASAAPVAGTEVGSGRAAARNVKYDFDDLDVRAALAVSRRRGDDVVEVKAAREAETEAVAIELLGGAGAVASSDGRFRLLDLAVFEDGTGDLVPMDRVGLSQKPLFASAVVSKAEGAPRSAGVAVARIGPLSAFGVDGIPASFAAANDSSLTPVALTLTSAATGQTYVVSRAASAYRKLLAHVQEEAELSAETARALVAALEENKKSAVPATATPPSHESIVIRLARARAGKPYGGPRAALEACGAFVLEALERHAPELVAAAAVFAAELEDKVKAARGAAGRVRGSGISISDAAGAAKDKGKAPVAAALAAASAAADPKGKGKAAVAVLASSSVSAAPAAAASFRGKASAIPQAERLALREGDFARQVAAKAASAEGLVKLQIETDASVKAEEAAAADGGGRGRKRRGVLEVTAAQAERFASRAAASASGSGDGAYIVLSMSELADEYPAPSPAPDRDADANDEIELLGGEQDFFDAGANPDELQSFDLFDFSLFNSDSMMTPLELVPAFSGGEPPVEVFAMGRLADHDEDTAFARPEQVVAAARAAAAANDGAAGSSSAAADASSPPAPIGMPLLLSQIQEWWVEGAADLDSCQLWVRTELARYRLVTPDPAYAPWFAVVLKAVHWAIRCMHAVGDAPRASRVSFDDIVKLVAAEREASFDFVSSSPRAVERFLVCHGQIILNQFVALLQQDRTQAAKAVAQCVFVQQLRSKMLERRHLKLYAPSKAALKAMQLAARKASSSSAGRPARRSLRSNPMKDRAAARSRAAPMTATATAMVRAVWQSYFAAAGVGRGGSGDGEAPVGDASSAVVAAKAIPLKVYAKEVKVEAAAVAAAGAAGPIAKEVEEADPNADDDEDEEAGKTVSASLADGGADARAAAAKPSAVPRPSLAPAVLGAPLPGPIDASPLGLAGPVAFYSKADIGDEGKRTEVALGDVVSLAAGVELSSLGEHDDVARYLAVSRQRSQDAELPETPLMGIVQAIFVAADPAAADGGKAAKSKAAGSAVPCVQLRVVVHGCDTVLGDAASDAELFVTPRFAVFPLAEAAEKLDASRRQRRWDPKDTALHAAEALEDEKLREGNNEKLAASKPLSYIYRTSYLPLKGMFQILPADLGLGKPVANEPAPEKGLDKGRPAVKADPAKGVAAAAATFKKDGVEFKVGDAVYLPPDAFDADEEPEPAAAAEKSRKKKGSSKKAAPPSSDNEEEEEEEEEAPPAVDASGKLLPGSRSRFHKGGANLGLRAFAVAIITAVPAGTGSNPKASNEIVVTRCARPEDVSEDVAYEAGWWDIFVTSESVAVDAASIIRKCHVVSKASAPAASPLVSDAAIEGVFTCVGTADLKKKKVDHSAVPGSLPDAGAVLEELKRENKALASSAASANAAAERHGASKAQGDGISLATMDIFAGCGGLSEGLHQYRAAHAKWAVEYEHPAAVSFLSFFGGGSAFFSVFFFFRRRKKNSPLLLSLSPSLALSLSAPPSSTTSKKKNRRPTASTTRTPRCSRATATSSSPRPWRRPAPPTSAAARTPVPRRSPGGRPPRGTRTPTVAGPPSPPPARSSSSAGVLPARATRA